MDQGICGFPTRLSHRVVPRARRGLTPLGRLQKYPKIHVSTGEESSGSGTDYTQGLRPRHRLERNPERPPSNSHVHWPFLRPTERVPEVPVLSREHLPHLAWRGEPPGFSRVAEGALDLRPGPQGPALLASGKASPHASCSGASRVSTPVYAGA